MLADVPLAKNDHLAKFERRVDMQEGERRLTRGKCLDREMGHHRRVFANRVEHHGVVEFRCYLADDMDALRLQLLQVSQLVVGHVMRSVLR